MRVRGAVRPELERLLAGLEREMAALRLAVRAHAAPVRPGSRDPRYRKAAADISALDRAYALATGVVLTEETAPEYRGVLDRGHHTPSGVTFRLFRALERARAGIPTARPETARYAARYFASIWPSAAPWPADVARPVVGRDV